MSTQGHSRISVGAVVRVVVAIVAIVGGVGFVVRVVGGGDTVDTAVIVVNIVVSIVASVVSIRDGAKGKTLAQGHRRWRHAGDGMLRHASGLLPAEIREEYLEEWRGWLWDMRQAGEPRHRRLGALVSILLAIPHLALVLRVRRRRVVE